MTQFIKSYIICVILSLSWVWGQCDGCNPGTTEYFNPDSLDSVDCEEWITNIEDCNQGDLDVLQEFIDNSQGGDNPPPSDLSPIELGSQVWEDGRLVDLCSSTSSTLGCQTDYNLSGEIPNSIGSLTNLTLLFLYLNELTGTIPPEIGNLTDLTELDLSGNQLTEIPSEIGNLTNLTQLRLDFNQLTGSIPPEIGNLTNLTRLYLYYNQLSGSIPSEIGNLTNLTILRLSSNELTGSIPSEIGNLTNLTELWLSSNELTGSIPPEIGNLTNLGSLGVRNNQFTGTIPPEIGNLTNLYFLFLDENQLTGLIPVEIGNLTNLTYLWLSSNELTGSIPPEIGNLTNLWILKLRANQFTSISDSICNLTNLSWSLGDEYVDSNIYDNQLCPPYPSCIEDYVGEQDCQETSISEQPVPIIYSLSSPYPNPFNPTTTIQFSLPQSDMVSMKVYDLKGRLIETLLNDFYDMGNHTITWDGSQQSSGMYFVRLESGEFIQTRKVVLVK